MRGDMSTTYPFNFKEGPPVLLRECVVRVPDKRAGTIKVPKGRVDLSHQAKIRTRGDYHHTETEGHDEASSSEDYEWSL